MKTMTRLILTGTTAITAIATSVTIETPVQAAAINLGGLTFSEESPGFEITDGMGTGSQADPFVIFETINSFNNNGNFTNPGGAAPNVTLLIEGIGNIGNLSGSGHRTGFFLRKVVTNNTNFIWDSFEHELQEILSQASPDSDGLSFGQGFRRLNRGAIISSDVYDDFNEQFLARDSIRFFNGSVAPGETVIFDYLITDNSPSTLQSPPGGFHLLQAANTTALMPDDPSQVTGGPLAPVPEPLTIFGSATALGFGALLKREHSKKQKKS